MNIHYYNRDRLRERWCTIVNNVMTRPHFYRKVHNRCHISKDKPIGGM